MAPRVVINYIHRGPIDEKYNSERKRERLLRAASVREHVNFIQHNFPSGDARPMDGVITFPPLDPNRVLHPHKDVLILTLGISDFDVRQILVDPGSSINLLQLSTYRQMGFSPSALKNLRRILSRFNGASTISLGDVVLLVQAGPVIQNVHFSMVEDLSPFNTIMECTDSYPIGVSADSCPAGAP
uniref:Uncharacterized protein n=1 Tax=Vitis vinifera TaxID=29760 RepID=A5BH95_VITVI|nr:hypothetical protein VITISV_038597 [Vitis vinifera]